LKGEESPWFGGLVLTVICRYTSTVIPDRSIKKAQPSGYSGKAAPRPYNPMDNRYLLYLCSYLHMAWNQLGIVKTEAP
jgi:hypothetical protein